MELVTQGAKICAICDDLRGRHRGLIHQGLTQFFMFHVSPLFGILWSGATKCLYIRFMLANIIIHCQCAVRPLKYPKTEI